LSDKLDALGLDSDDQDELLGELKFVLEVELYPSYERLIAWFEEREKTASTDDGVWKFPDGAAFYAYKARSYTTTELTPEEIHQIGLAGVERIQAEMKQILAAEGYATDDFGATMQALNKEPRFLYPDTDEGRAQILKDYQTIIDEI